MAQPIDVKIFAGAVAPTATITPDATGATITITDSEGTHSAHINNGVNGQNGAPGAPGATGATGPQGPTGARGAGITSITEGADKRLAIAYGDGQIFYTSPVEGPMGPQGATGPQGPVGPTGPQGTRGTSINDVMLLDNGKLAFIFSDGTIDYVTPKYLPTVSAADNGKVLKVVNGVWTAASL